jgi:hypothetical protein
METNLAPILVTVYASVVAFIAGWAMPRGKYLKAIQLRLIKGVHNFFADEEEYIAHKAQKIKKAVKRKS